MKAEFTLEYLTKADDWACRAAEKAVEAIATADALKEHSKDLLAAIMCRLDRDGTIKLSESKLERLARNTVEWKTFRSGQVSAMQEAVKAKQSATNAERHFETVRSGISYRKAELSRLGSD